MLYKNTKILVISRDSDRRLFQNSIYHVDFSLDYKPLSLTRRGIRRFWHLLDIPGFCRSFLNFSGKSLVSYDVVILCQCLYAEDVIQYIRKFNPNCRLIYWMWNSYKGGTVSPLYNDKKIFRRICLDEFKDRYNLEIWSFDHIDCANFNLKYNNTFCAKLHNIKPSQVKYDVGFWGLDKGRINIIKKLAIQFNELGVTYCMKVIPDKRTSYKNEDKSFFAEGPMPYEKFVQKELEAHCLLEIVQEGQADITWRTLEAQFYGRKLITNCHNVKNYDFYNPQNIFILGEDSLDSLKIFISEPVKKIDENILRKYKLDGWLENFFI